MNPVEQNGNPASAPNLTSIEPRPHNVIQHLTKQLSEKSLEAAQNWDGMQQLHEMYVTAQSRILELELEMTSLRGGRKTVDISNEE